MLQAILRDDGSVSGLHGAGPAAEAPSASGTRRTIVPLDGLPRTAGRSAPAMPLEDLRDSWSGGFSFAVWDPEARTLRAYRDHYGARPLYYHLAPDRILLASDLPALLPAPPAVDEVAVMEYLAGGVLSEHRSFYRGVKRLPAASLLRVGPGGPKVERYWSPFAGQSRTAVSERDLDATFRDLFRTAVRETLAGEEPAGVLLSGGPDSSVILGMASRLVREGEVRAGPPRVALTMVFDAVRRCDESAPASETAAALGIPWRAVAVEGHSPLYGFDEFLRSFGEPPCAVNLAPETLLHEAARALGVRVLLDGHDADALFTPSGAYLGELLRRFRLVRFGEEVNALRRFHRLALRRMARMTLSQLAPPWSKRLRRIVPRWLNREAARRTDLEARLRRPATARPFAEAEAERVCAPAVGLTLEATRCLERMHGIEGRHPFFHPDLVRFLTGIPLEARYRRGRSKILLRRSLADLLTPATQRRIDKTDYTPYFDWSLRTHLGPRLAALRDGGSALLDPFVDPRHAGAMIGRFLEGGAADRYAIWRLVALERWLVIYSGAKSPGGLHEANAPGQKP